MASTNWFTIHSTAVVLLYQISNFIGCLHNYNFEHSQEIPPQQLDIVMNNLITAFRPIFVGRCGSLIVHDIYILLRGFYLL